MLKNLFIALSLLVFVAACDQAPQPKTGKDGYTFYNKQYEKETVTVDIKEYGSQKELYEFAKTRGIDYPEIIAFSSVSESRSHCTMHIIDPTVSYEPEFVGHEFLHCVYGQWHKDNDTF